MSKYYVDLIRHTVLDRREVIATTKKEAEEKAIPTFNKYDLDDYDDIWIEKSED